MTLAQDQDTTARPVPRLKIAALYALAATAAFAPCAFAVFSWPAIVTAFIVVSATTFYSMGARTQYLGATPRPVEVALALFGYSAGGSVVGFLGVCAYASAMSVVGLVKWVFGFDAPEWVYTWVAYGSLATALFLLFDVVNDDAPEILDNLYPGRRRQHSPYAEFLFQPKQRRSWYVRLGSAAAMVASLAVWWSTGHVFESRWFGRAVLALGLEFSIALPAIDLWLLKSTDRQASSPKPVDSQIRTLLQAAGYQVRIYPRTGDREADSLIGLIDFLAIRPGRAIAGCITTERDPSLLRHIAASLRPGLWALQDRLSPEERIKVEIEPVIVIVGGSTPLDNEPEISASIDRMNVRIIRSPSEGELAAILSDSDEGGKERIARELFDPPLDANDLSGSSTAAVERSGP